MLEQAGYRVVDCEKRARDERLVIAFKNDVFQLVDQEELDYNKLAEKGKGKHAKGNKALLVCI